MPTQHAVDLSDLEGFWTAPIAERADGFARLRAAGGLPWFESSRPRRSPTLGPASTR